MSDELLRSDFLRDFVENTIESDENKKRKRSSYIAYDIYNNNQHQYVMDCLCKDYPRESVSAMRTVTSINFAKRIVDVEAGVYKHKPVRTFMAGNDLVEEQLEFAYHSMRLNEKNKMANKFYRLDEQCASMIVPNKRRGIIGMRTLQNWQYDAIPDPDWPAEDAMAYIIPVGDALNFMNQKSDSSEARYILWSDRYNFMFNGQGKIITPMDEIDNPIGILPIVDISREKQGSFLKANDNNISRFAVDFLCQLSDHATNVQMQGYAQAILSATEVPKEIMVGPQRILFLQKKKNSDASEQPEFRFESPSPDIQASMESLMSFLRMFLSSRGNKTNVVTSGSNTHESASSGFERLLMMIEQHEMSLDDFELFETVERKQFGIIKKYCNYLQSASDFNLDPRLSGPEVGDDVELDIEFYEPTMLESSSEKQSRLNERLDNGTLSRVRYVMEMDNVDEDTARDIIAEADSVDDLAE